MDLRFHFDPACPWSWATYLWLEQASRRDGGVAIRFGLVSLLELNKDNEMPGDMLEVLGQSRRLQRVLSVLVEAERWGEVDRIYNRIGASTFEVGGRLDAGVVDRICAEACPEDSRAWLDDGALDEKVVAMHHDAMALAGPGVGSPIISADGKAHGLYGPIVDARLSEREGDSLLSIVKGALELSSFYELKRSHPGSPNFG